MDMNNELLMTSKKQLSDFSSILFQSSRDYREGFKHYLIDHVADYKKEANKSFRRLLDTRITPSSYALFKEDYLNMLMGLSENETVSGYLLALLQYALDYDARFLLKMLEKDFRYVFTHCNKQHACMMMDHLIDIYKKHHSYVPELFDTLMNCISPKQFKDFTKALLKEGFYDEAMIMMEKQDLPYELIRDYAFKHLDHHRIREEMRNLALKTDHQHDLMVILENSDSLNHQDYETLLLYYQREGNKEKYRRLLKQMVCFEEPFDLLDYRAYKDLYKTGWPKERDEIIACRSDLDRGAIYYEEEMDDELLEWLSIQNLATLKSFTDCLKDDYPQVLLKFYHRAIIDAAYWCESAVSVRNLLDDVDQLKAIAGGDEMMGIIKRDLKAHYPDHQKLMAALGGTL